MRDAVDQQTWSQRSPYTTTWRSPSAISTIISLASVPSSSRSASTDKAAGHQQVRLNLEGLLTRHAAADDFGVKAFNADASFGQYLSQAADDAQTVFTDEFQLDAVKRIWHFRAVGAGDDDLQAAGFKPAQRIGQCIGVFAWHLEVNGAGKFGGEPGQATGRPIGAEALP